tara:strand:- start:5553 stop:6797 length:1245 start_codon:yes stop_codon:yes gene_type:complete
MKKLFSREKEKEEEKIELSGLIVWLDGKEKPLLENLKNEISRIIDRINDGKGKLFEDLEKLEKAKLQNPNIPNRAMTIMEGNREAFVKKISHLFSNIDLEYSDFDEITKKSKELEKGIDSFGKGTARSYQILNEFFAREVASVAMNIKKIETNSKSIRNLSDYSKISKIKKIKEDIDDLNSKIKLKSELLEELKEEKGRVEAAESDLLGTKKKIKDIEAGEEYGNFENLLKEKEGFEGKLKEIGDRLFHDFSSLEKALKKYGKIAFENGKLVEEYLKDPVKALAGDDELKIIKILSSLKQAIKDDKLGLDVRKGEKTLLKIKELEGDYFGTLRGDYKNIKEKLDKTNLEVKNTEVKKQLQSNNEKLEIIKNNIENLNNKVSLINNEIGKIDIEKLKKNLQEKINDTINERIILV